MKIININFNKRNKFYGYKINGNSLEIYYFEYKKIPEETTGIVDFDADFDHDEMFTVNKEFLLVKKSTDIISMDDIALGTNNFINVGFDSEGVLVKYNLPKETFLGKEKGSYQRQLHGLKTICVLHIPHSDGIVEDLYVFSDSSEYSINKVVDEEVETFIKPDTVAVSLTGVTEIAPDGLVILNAKLMSTNGSPILKDGVELYIKTNIGYLNKVKLITDSNGEASFKFRATDLDVGDRAIVKIGFKYYTNVENIEIEVK